jgi:Domain of unknown function (DUF4397)
MLAVALLLGACGGESSLPKATGKGSIRAINAMPASPDLNFLIEERSIGTLPYRSATAISNWDDLDYTFNFDVFFAGDTQTTRIASEYIDVVADQEYTLVISGSLASPTVTIWETTEREFATGATVFQVRFAQNADYFTGPIDYYFAPVGVAPASGEAVATLSYGEMATAQDFESGSYVLTITSANNPADILYTSGESAYTAQADLIVSTFNATPSDIGNFTVQLIGASGGSARLVDSTVPASVEFLHAAMDLGTSDIYDDETLLSQVLANHAYEDLSAGIQITPGVNTFRYVPAGSMGAITLEGELNASPGIRYRIVAGGVSTAFQTMVTVPDRRPVESAAKVGYFQTSNNYAFLNLYLVAQGESIDGKSPIRAGFPPFFDAAPSEIAPGNYDAYITEFGETAVLAGPVNVDIALGDVVELVVFDTADPAVLDLRLFGHP